MKTILKTSLILTTSCFVYAGSACAIDYDETKVLQPRPYVDDQSYVIENTGPIQGGASSSSVFNAISSLFFNAIQSTYNNKMYSKPNSFLIRLAFLMVNKGDIYSVMNDGSQWVMARLVDEGVDNYRYNLACDPDRDNIIKIYEKLTQQNKQYDLVETCNTAQHILSEHHSSLEDNVTFRTVLKMQMTQGDLQSVSNDFYLIIMRGVSTPGVAPNTRKDIEGLTLKLNGLDPKRVQEQKQEEEREKAAERARIQKQKEKEQRQQRGDMYWPDGVPISEQGIDVPTIRGHRLFSSLMCEYNQCKDPMGFTESWGKARTTKQGNFENLPVYGVMKNPNKPENPWEIIELIGDKLTQVNQYQKGKEDPYAVQERKKLIDFVTKDHPSYELIPYGEHTDNFFVYQMKTEEGTIQDDFYLIEGVKDVPDYMKCPSAERFVRGLNQLAKGRK